jgi:hypothetical protein
VSKIPFIAASEDETLEWYDRSARRGRVRRLVARNWSEPRWMVSVQPEHMRPATAEDDRGGLVEEGWHFVCDPDHPAAIAVWRAEPREAPAWWWTTRRRLRALHPAIRRRERGVAVLWGARVTRDATWLDRLLLGRCHRRVLGDQQLRLGLARWQWCETCGARRPHCVDRREDYPPTCLAPDHFDKRARAERAYFAAALTHSAHCTKAPAS